MLVKTLKIVLSVLAIFIALIPFIIVKPISVLPYNNIPNGETSSDIEWGGDSISTVIEHSREIVKYESHLKSTYAYPFSGFTFNFKKNKSFIFRNTIKYNIEATESKILRFNIGIPVSGRANFVYESNFIPGNRTRYLSLSDMHPAHWWYDNHDLTIESFPPPKMKNIVLFSVVNSFESPINVKETISIREIKIILHPGPYIIISLLILSLLLFYEIFIVRKKSKEVVEYREVDIANQENLESNLVIKYIGNNYNISNINIDMVAENTGVSKYRIPEIIRDKFNTTFPGYLNKIRILEVKRLLVESELSVLDISIAVGYNSVSHFNRTFKKNESVTPLSYRKSQKKMK